MARFKTTYNAVELFFWLLGFYIIFLSAALNEFSKSLEATLLFIAGIGLVLTRTRGVKWMKDKVGLWLLFGCFSITIIHFLTSGVFQLGSLKFVALIMGIYHLIKQHHVVYVRILFSVLQKMVFITIPFYIAHVLAPSLLRGLLSPLNISSSAQGDDGGIYVFFYNINPWHSNLYSTSVVRNSGFMWEPGAFGAMLTFLIVYRFLFIDQLKVSRTTTLIFFYSLTSLSTTTFLALFMCLLFLVFYKFRNNILKLSFYLSILLVLSVPVYNQPFIKGKIDLYMESNTDYQSVYDKKKVMSEKKSIGRFAGMLIEFDRVKSRPLLGYGWDGNYEAVGIGNHWSNPNGLADLLGKFGFVGMFFIGFGLFGFFPRTLSLNKAERLILVAVLVLPIFSNPLQLNPIMWSIIMLGFVNGINTGKNQVFSTARISSASKTSA